MASGTVRIEVYGRTDAGRIRETNEDVFTVGDLDAAQILPWPGDGPGGVHALTPSPRGPLVVVCDGMGGTAGGSVASALAADAVWHEMRIGQPSVDREVYARLLRRAVRIANRRVFDKGRQDPALRGMGTTVSAAGVAGATLVLAQVGDSRAYVLRGGDLVQVTRDQSVVSALVQAGRIAPDQARSYPKANVILQALGVRRDVDVALSVVDLRRGDRLLLCSDGLHGFLSDESLTSILGMRPDLPGAVDLLIDAALAAGSSDNVTAVVASFAGDGLPEPEDGELPAFQEFDPMEEGQRALATTSRVARRLAARAGILDDPGPTIVPATGQHAVVVHGDPGGADSGADSGASEDVRGPAERALLERGRVGLVAWMVAALVLAALVAAVLWGLL